MRAFPYIKAAVPDARLIVVGAFSDEEKAPFVRYARTHRLRSVHFVGWVSREAMSRYYRAATVFCAPSTGFESFGIVLLEAMAAGIPIVASDIAGYRSVLTDGVEGRLVPPNDEKAIADATIRLLQEPETRTAMKARGRATAAGYDWPIIAQNVLDYYGELAQARTVIAARPTRFRRALERLSLA